MHGRNGSVPAARPTFRAPSSVSPPALGAPGQLRFVRGKVRFSTHREQKQSVTPRPPSQSVLGARKKSRPQTQARVRTPQRNDITMDVSIDYRVPTSLNSSIRQSPKVEANSWYRTESVRGARTRDQHLLASKA